MSTILGKVILGKKKTTAPPKKVHPDVKANGANQLVDFNFADPKFANNVKAMKKHSKRFLKGRGEFDAVCKKAEEAQEAYKGFLANKVTLQDVTQKLEELEQTASSWLKDDEGRGKGDDIRQFKEMVCRDQIQKANIALTQLKNQTKLKDPALQKKFKTLQEKRTAIESGQGTPELIDEYRALDAAILSEVCGMKKPGGGTSEVYLIKNPDGSVAYAFKPMKGEASQMGTPEGAGAVREVLMSKLCDTIKAKYDLDFGWPSTTMAKMDIGGGNMQSGALVDGISGEVFASEAPKAGTTNRTESEKIQAEYDKQKAKANAVLSKLPAKEIQKIALCNLAMGNFDIKWDNAMIDDGPHGLSAKPFDAGVSVPDMDTFMRLCHVGTVGGGGSLGEGGLKNPGGNFTMDLDGNPLKSAKEKIDKDLLDKFKKINVDELETLMKDEIARLEKSYQVPCSNLGLDKDNAFTVTKECIKKTQALLDDKKMTLEGFVTGFQTNMIDAMVDSKKDDWTPKWEKQMKAEHAALKKKYPILVQDRDEAKDIFLDYTSPAQMDSLKKIVALTDPNATDLKTKYPELKWPKGTFKTCLGHLEAVIRDQQAVARRAILEPLVQPLKDQILATDEKQAIALVKQFLQQQKNLVYEDNDASAIVKKWQLEQNLVIWAKSLKPLEDQIKAADTDPKAEKIVEDHLKEQKFAPMQADITFLVKKIRKG